MGERENLFRYFVFFYRGKDNSKIRRNFRWFTLRDFINKKGNLNGILENHVRKTKNRKIILKIKRERSLCF